MSREIFTKGGRQSSACFLSTENPPCVLVSEAVSIFVNLRGTLCDASVVRGDGEGGTSASSLFTSEGGEEEMSSASGVIGRRDICA